MADLAGAGYHAVAPWMRGYSPTGLAPDGNYQVASLALDAHRAWPTRSPATATRC